MKTSVMLMAGILAVALAGSAQAATMFAVQNAGGTQDMATISDTGEIAGSKLAIGLNATNVPNFNPLTTVAQGNLHAATSGNGFANAAMLLQHAATLNASLKYATSAAPNFSFYRINKDQNTGIYSLPQATDGTVANNANLGFLNFGTLDTTKDPNSGTYRKNLVTMLASAEFNATNPNAWGTLVTNTPAYLSFWTTSNASTASTPVSNVYSEKMRLSSVGNLGINTIAPTSKLHVVGLPYYSSNANALAGGLTAGAFYACGGNGTTAYVAPADTASQSLCVAY